MRKVLATSLVGALALLSAGCDEQVYPCHADANCVVFGAQGRCLSAGTASYCAFPYQEVSVKGSPSIYCPSGYRWDSSAPEEIQATTLQPPKATDGG